MIHVNNLYSDNKLFRTMASSLKIEGYLANTVRDMTYGVETHIERLEEICSEIGEHFRFLQKYWKQSHNDDVSGSSIERKELKREVLSIAEKYNLFDPIVEARIKQIDEWYKGVELLKYVEITDESLPEILKTLRNNKKKLSLDLYQRIITEDKFTIKGVDKKQLSLELVIQEVSDKPKFQILTHKAA